MKQSGMFRFILFAFLGALVIYFTAFYGIEHLRNRKGPWEVTFTTNEFNRPILIVNQPYLKIDHVVLTLDTNLSGTSFPTTNLSFARPREVPYALPFGECIFMDTTFLPGTVTFNMFGNEIELLPRVLIVNKEEVPWQSGASLLVSREGVLQEPARPF